MRNRICQHSMQAPLERLYFHATHPVRKRVLPKNAHSESVKTVRSRSECQFCEGSHSTGCGLWIETLQHLTQQYCTLCLQDSCWTGPPGIRGTWLMHFGAMPRRRPL